MLKKIDYKYESEHFSNLIKQARAIDLKVLHATERQLVMELPYARTLAGNPETHTLHGGAIITLIDSCCCIAARNALNAEELCPTLDLRIDYHRTPAVDIPVYAKATCTRVTQHIVFLECVAYQNQKEIARCTTNFMRLGKKISLGNEYITQDQLHDSPNSYSAPDETTDLITLLKSGNLQDAINAVPYAKFIGVELHQQLNDEKHIFKLLPKTTNLGNPVFPAIHGGVVGGFMQLSAGLHLLFSNNSSKLT